MEPRTSKVHLSASDGDLCDNCDSVSFMHLDYLDARPKPLQKPNRKLKILKTPKHETVEQRNRILRIIQLIWRRLRSYCSGSPAGTTRKKNDISIAITSIQDSDMSIGKELFPPDFDLMSSKYKYHMTSSVSN